jgi:hypothetical protein
LNVKDISDEGRIPSVNRNIQSYPEIVNTSYRTLSSVLMNGADLYASRMMLLQTPVSASALNRCS